VAEEGCDIIVSVFIDLGGRAFKQNVVPYVNSILERCENGAAS